MGIGLLPAIVVARELRQRQFKALHWAGRFSTSALTFCGTRTSGYLRRWPSSATWCKALSPTHRLNRKQSSNWRRRLGKPDTERIRACDFGGFEASTENSYLAGPRYVFRSFGRFRPYVQGLIGVGNINYPFKIGSASYFAVAPSGGVSYRLNSKFALRAGYEYQFWINSPGYATEPNHQLMPNGAQIGLAYSIFR